ncbi:MAG: L-glutamate gamma-semialdehyde dehydrogenase, partial [Lentisphaeria bacterium]
MSQAIFKVEEPHNEPYKSYAPGTPERESLKAKLTELKSREIEIPAIIGGKEIKTDRTCDVVCPHDHRHKLATAYLCGKEESELAIKTALEAREKWANLPWEERAAVFNKAADLVTGPYRDLMNASTMLGQSKTANQAEIEAAGELADFFRFNSWYLYKLLQDQPHSPDGLWNRVEYRALEGFVFAVSPFNFTAIAGNLPGAPALCGNVVLWKPSPTALYSNYFLMKILEEAGMPAGVINFLPGTGGDVGDPVLKSPDLAGLHFTGSQNTFEHLWKTIGNNISTYKTYPRIVGETGGKDFIFAHNSADVDKLVVGALRAAYEYQGQKCSAASRMYLPKSKADEFIEKFKTEVAKVTYGDIEDFSHFMGAVIDKKSFDKISGYIDFAKEADDAEIIIGGEYDDSKGYFIAPTAIKTSNPHFKTMGEEIFGPVLTVYVYDDDKLEETLDLCDNTSLYALTGAIFARERHMIKKLSDRLRNAAGNFYINDKPTPAIVNQQPFGGSRKSGTNDKAGSIPHLYRWLS